MRFSQRVIAVAALLMFGLLAVRQQMFVEHFAVNILYWDSWDIYQPLFDHRGGWALFDLQHGPHRQGVGGLLIGIYAPLSHWDARWDAYCVSYTLMLAALAGIWLALRCGVGGWGLLAVPLIYLNIRQCHMFIATANPSHGAVPMLLFTLYCLALFLKSLPWRLCVLSVLTFLLIFTGFGLFAGFITPVLLIVEFIHIVRRNAPQRARQATYTVLAMVVTAVSWIVFLIGYQIHATGITFSHGSPPLYFGFIGAMFGNFFGLGQASPMAVVVGLFAFVCLLVVCLYHFSRLLKWGINGGNTTSAVIFCCSAFALLFSTQAAEGRVGFGWQTGASSRYVTLMIPMAMALLIHLAASPSLERYRLSIIFTCLLALGTGTLNQTEIDGAQRLHDGCLAWESAYLQTRDPAAADRIAHFAIYEGDLSNRLEQLRRAKLNLFDSAQTTPQRVLKP